MVNKQLLRDTVYKVDSLGKTFPTVQIKGAGTVDVYVSNELDKPANAGAMTADPSDIDKSGVLVIYGRPRWILFATKTGTPEIFSNNLITILQD